MVDAQDQDSEEWPQENEEMGEEEWGDEDDDDLMPTDNVASLEKQTSLQVAVRMITPDQIRERFEKQISAWDDTYCMGPDAMLQVARHFKYQEARLVDWYDNAQFLSLQLGLTPNPLVQKDKECLKSTPEGNDGYCTVCYDELDKTNTFNLDCMHQFCTDCWFVHLSTAISNGMNICTAMCM